MYNLTFAGLFGAILFSSKFYSQEIVGHQLFDRIYAEACHVHIFWHTRRTDPLYNEEMEQYTFLIHQSTAPVTISSNEDYQTTVNEDVLRFWRTGTINAREVRTR